jgi:universal stress protein A
MTTQPSLNPPATAKDPAPDLGEQDALSYRSMLVPVDFSEHTEKTVSHATKLASRFEAKLTLLHVFQTPEYASLPYQGTRLKLDELKLTSEFSLAEQLAAEKLAELESRLRQQGLKVESLLSKGRPFERIVEVATAADVDLIVIGSHGQSGLTRLTRLLLGSTAGRVVELASCPVWLPKTAVSDRTDPELERPTPGSRFHENALHPIKVGCTASNQGRTSLARCIWLILVLRAFAVVFVLIALIGGSVW